TTAPLSLKKLDAIVRLPLTDESVLNRKPGDPSMVPEPEKVPTVLVKYSVSCVSYGAAVPEARNNPLLTKVIASTWGVLTVPVLRYKASAATPAGGSRPKPIKPKSSNRFIIRVQKVGELVPTQNPPFQFLDGTANGINDRLISGPIKRAPNKTREAREMIQKNLATGKRAGVVKIGAKLVYRKNDRPDNDP